MDTREEELRKSLKRKYASSILSLKEARGVPFIVDLVLSFNSAVCL